MLDGRSLKLAEGLVESATSGIAVSLDWYEDDPAVIVLTEKGVLAEK